MRTLLTTLHSKYIHASLALPCLAAFCGEECGEILQQEFTLHEPKESVLGQIVALQPDVVCFSVYIWNRQASLELAEALQLVLPDLRIVLGGPEVSFVAEDFFQRYPVAALISGEGERPLKHLLSAWLHNQQPGPLPGLRTRENPGFNGRQSQLQDLDLLPSPFQAGLVDLSRTLVYFESSRGCPYNCSFCMSSLDDQVRSFSMARIKADLLFLMEKKVAQIKFVDRTFNYNNARSQEIFSFILQHNRSSRFHFEIGAHLLDDATLEVLAGVPPGIFQFEIGVQSTLPETLARIDRQASLQLLAKNVERLRRLGTIHLHLDLIAGLPGESFEHFLRSLDWTAALSPHHLQLEPVKLLPGAPLRAQAAELGLKFDPNPPYSVLQTRDISFNELERLRGIGRLLDLFYNSGRFSFLLKELVPEFGGLSQAMASLDNYWREQGFYHQSRSLRDLYGVMYAYLKAEIAAENLPPLREALARDYAHHERVVPGREPEFFNVALSETEQLRVRQRVKAEISGLRREGKLQYAAGVFEHLSGSPGRSLLLYLYQTRSGSGLEVREIPIQ